MATFILPSKLVAERITVWFPFQAELEILESILTWEVTVTVFSGEDTSPELLLYQVAALSGQEVSQQIEAGVPGVIYLLTATITTDLGQTVQHTAKLAILPTPEIIPDLLAVWYTTELYSIEVSEQYAHGMDFVDGRLRPQPFPVEYMQHGLAFVSGTLRDVLVEFSTEESYTHGLVFIDGTLENKLVSFVTEESYTHGLNFISGTIESKLVSYVARAEQYTHGLQFISGTLT